MQDIHDAAAQGNVSRVRELVERHGKDPTALDGDAAVGDDSDDEPDWDEDDAPMGPAHHAAASDAPFVSTYLLGVGVPVDQPDGLRRTPLYHAARAGSTKSAVVLLRSGADACKGGRTRVGPIGVAARNGHVEVLKLLLAHFDDDDGRRVRRHAALEAKDIRNWRTPLLMALAAGKWEAAQVLLDAAATCRDGRDAAELAALVDVDSGDEDSSMAGTAPQELQSKIVAAAAEPERAHLLAKARLLGDAALSIHAAVGRARDYRKHEREVRRQAAVAAPACLRGRVEAQAALPTAAVALTPSKPWDEEAAELSAVITRVVGAGNWPMAREHVRELMTMVLPEWAWAAAEGEEA